MVTAKAPLGCGPDALAVQPVGEAARVVVWVIMATAQIRNAKGGQAFFAKLFERKRRLVCCAAGRLGTAFYGNQYGCRRIGYPFTARNAHAPLDLAARPA